MGKKFIAGYCVSLLLCASLCSRVFAELSSDHFRIGGAKFKGSTVERMQSASLSLEEGGIDFFTKEKMASKNFSVEGDIGFALGPRLARIQSIDPGDLSRFFLDEPASYKVQAEDEDLSSLRYRLLQDDQVRVPYQSSPVLSYGLSPDDKGRHPLVFEVRNAEGGVVSASQQSYHFRRPRK